MGFLYAYTLIVGLTASTPQDFVLCVLPLFIICYYLNKKPCLDIVVFSPHTMDEDIASLYSEAMLQSGLYSNVRLLRIDVRDEDDRNA